MKDQSTYGYSCDAQLRRLSYKYGHGFGVVVVLLGSKKVRRLVGRRVGMHANQGKGKGHLGNPKQFHAREPPMLDTTDQANKQANQNKT